MIATLCAGAAAGTLIQPLGWNQTSHYALTRALDRGTAQIDPDHKLTGDKTFKHGHWYSPRAPGLAIASLPLYEAFEGTGVTHHYRKHIGGRNNNELIWLMTLWGSMLPAMAMMLLVFRVAERVEPGFGAPAAVTLGLGTLVLTFTTVLFSHVLSACLAFGAFALLFRERAGPARGGLWPVAFAGALAGYAVTTEYALFLVAVVLGIYAVSSGDLVRRAGAYLAGAAAGVVPLALYNHLAFKSVFHIGYADVANQRSGFFGVHLPKPGVAMQLLLSSHGLLTLTPVVGMGAAGTVLLYRRGFRAEAAVVAAVALGFLAYSSGYFLPFGGAVPASRFLIPALPFLCFPLALAYRRWPGPTIALAGASIVAIGIPTLTRPLPGGTTDLRIWTDLLESGHLAPTIVTIFKLHNEWLALVPTFALVIAALVLAVRATPRLAVGRRSAVVGLVLVGVWALFTIFGPHDLGIDRAAAKLLNADNKTAKVEGLDHRPLVDLALFSLAAGAIALAAMFGVSRRRPDPDPEPSGTLHEPDRVLA